MAAGGLFPCPLLLSSVQVHSGVLFASLQMLQPSLWANSCLWTPTSEAATTRESASCQGCMKVCNCSSLWMVYDLTISSRPHRWVKEAHAWRVEKFHVSHTIPEKGLPGIGRAKVKVGMPSTQKLRWRIAIHWTRSVYWDRQRTVDLATRLRTFHMRSGNSCPLADSLTSTSNLERRSS